QLNFKFVKFLLEHIEPQEISRPVLQNANVILMDNARQLFFPKKLSRGNSRDCLHNDLIDLLKEKGGGWPAGCENTRGKIFLEHLSSAIWYIDPHIQLLKSHSCDIPSLFQQLPKYKSGSIYNTYYFKTYQKKEKLSCQKLLEHCKSIEYSASEIWASKKCWLEIIPEVFNLAIMMRKYAEHSQKSLQLTNNAHYSTELVRTPSKHCKLKIILDNLKIDSKYDELEKNLANRELYNFIKIFKFLPSE
ncbi:3607_t:CDS:1, partial [Dentiscutata heterogama]